MHRPVFSAPVVLAAVSLLLIGLPPAWTGGVKLAVLGLASPGPDPAPPPAVPHPNPAGRDEEMDNLREQNQVLTQAVAQLREENAQLRLELQNLHGLRQVVREGTRTPVSAPVMMSRDASDWSRTLVIGCGTADGVAPGDPVVWGPRLVGIVAKDDIAAHACRVRLVTDGAFRAAALVVAPESGPSPAERIVGVLAGQGLDTCALEWVLHDARVEVGRPVVTGEDPLSNVPSYLLVGRVSEAEPQPGAFLRVRVRPALHYSNLTRVTVLTAGGRSAPAPAQPAAPPRPPAGRRR